MALRKFTPISFTPEESEALSAQTKVQEAPAGQPKSIDGKKYPVWSIPVGKKVLVYVPNHTVQDADGIDRLRMDNPLLHYMTVGKTFPIYRCTYGLVSEANGLFGNCPLCDGTSEPKSLANAIIEQKCKSRGLDPSDTDNQEVKLIRSAAFSDRALKDAIRHYTFPIVAFETLNDDGKTFVKDEDGNYKYTVYWYDCSFKVWEKWEKALEALEDAPSHPGGRFFLLNYIYTPKKGQQNARDAARELTVSARTVKGSEQLRAFLDEETKDWTPELARSTVYANMFYSEQDLQEVADEALENTRNMLTMYDAAKANDTMGIGAGSADGFKLSTPPVDDNGGDTPVEMETDMDVE